LVIEGKVYTRHITVAADAQINQAGIAFYGLHRFLSTAVKTISTSAAIKSINQYGCCSILFETGTGKSISASAAIYSGYLVFRRCNKLNKSAHLRSN
jgi:hypothetical protein